MLTVIAAAQHKRTTWAGGTTTELGIFPLDSSYAERTFEVRVSTATVELETSDFTALPGVTRYIMPLSAPSGSIALSHNGGSAHILKPFNIHTFDGADNTVCRGLCTDFNLMVRSPWKGSIQPMHADQTYNCGPMQMAWLYCLCDVTAVVNNDAGGSKPQLLALKAGDVLYIHPKGECTKLSVAAEALGLSAEQKNSVVFPAIFASVMQ